MSTQTDSKVNAADARKLGVYRDDLEWFEDAAIKTGRSKIRLFKFICSELKAGRAVRLDFPKTPRRIEFKRQRNGGRK